MKFWSNGTCISFSAASIYVKSLRKRPNQQAFVCGGAVFFKSSRHAFSTKWSSDTGPDFSPLVHWLWGGFAFRFPVALWFRESGDAIPVQLPGLIILLLFYIVWCLIPAVRIFVMYLLPTLHRKRPQTEGVYHFFKNGKPTSQWRRVFWWYSTQRRMCLFWLC